MRAAAHRRAARTWEAQALRHEARGRRHPAEAAGSTTVTLPDDVEIFLALQRVSPSEWLNRHLYPALIRAAGQRTSALGLVNLFALPIAGFADAGYPAAVVAQLHALVPEWIDALAADREVAGEAKRLHQDLLRHLGR
jgi:hypothetical protein